MRDILICPVCGKPLVKGEKSWHCAGSHSFDIAKEGYVNLLMNHGTAVSGDNKAMTASRAAFLNKGYYGILADAVGDILASTGTDNALDICCGEGYYTARLAERFGDIAYYGFDISKEMVRLAAKRRTGAEFFVANLSSVPVADSSVGFAMHLFAPFSAGEFCRVMRKGGTLVSVVPDERHLFGLKEILYDKPYLNEEKIPSGEGLELKDCVRVSREITVTGRQDIDALFGMTPYCYNTPAECAARLAKVETLTTPIGFILCVFEKKVTGAYQCQQEKPPYSALHSSIVRATCLPTTIRTGAISEGFRSYTGV